METIQEISIVDIVETLVERIEQKTGKVIYTEIHHEYFSKNPFYTLRFATDKRFYSEKYFIDAINPHIDLSELNIFLEYLFLDKEI